MKPELQQRIFSAYPQLFGALGRPRLGGCDCGDGWFALIDRLCSDLVNISAEYDIVIRVEQIKSKFGALRFYKTVTFGPRWKRRHDWLPKLLNACKRCVPPMWYWTLWSMLPGLQWTFDGRHFMLRRRMYSKGGAKALAYIGVTNLVDDTVNVLSNLSVLICERCGTTVDVKPTGDWVTYLCPACRVKAGVLPQAECQRCKGDLDARGYCEDETCPFSSHVQGCSYGWEGHPERAVLPGEECHCNPD